MGSNNYLAQVNELNRPNVLKKINVRHTDSYLFGVTVAHPELMKSREEQGSHGQNLCVELRGSGHGRGPRQKDHPLCSLRTEKQQRR